MPILLGPDGPSLGGFVCPVTTASAEFWKLGQLHPGDTIRFHLLTLPEAEALRDLQESNLRAIGEGDLERQVLECSYLLLMKRLHRNIRFFFKKQIIVDFQLQYAAAAMKISG